LAGVNNRKEGSRAIVAFDTDDLVTSIANDWAKQLESVEVHVQTSLPVVSEAPNYSWSKADHLTLVGHGSPDRFSTAFRLHPDELAGFLALHWLPKNDKSVEKTLDIFACGVGLIISGTNYAREVAEGFRQRGYDNITVCAVTSKSLSVSLDANDVRDFILRRYEDEIAVTARKIDGADSLRQFDDAKRKLGVMEAELRQLRTQRYEIENELEMLMPDSPELGSKTSALEKVVSAITKLENEVGSAKQVIDEKYPETVLASFADLDAPFKLSANAVSSSNPFASQQFGNTYHRAGRLVAYLDQKASTEGLNDSTRRFVEDLKPRLDAAMRTSQKRGVDAISGDIGKALAKNPKYRRRADSELTKRVDAYFEVVSFAVMLIEARISEISAERKRGLISRAQNYKLEKLGELKAKIETLDMSGDRKEAMNRLKAIVQTAQSNRLLTRRLVLRGESRTMQMLKRVESRIDQELKKNPDSSNPGPSFMNRGGYQQ